MLAPAALPEAYQAWNRKHHAPYGRAVPRAVTKVLGDRNPLVLRYRGPYGWQKNNTTRRFEFPWAFDQIQRLGSGLVIVDLGAGMAGLQFTLAQAHQRVIAIDPGMAPEGKRWTLDLDLHARLARAYKAPVILRPTTFGDAGLADASVDVVLSVSTIEHFTPADVHEFTREARRVLKPGGHLVLTIDLFIDVHPFTSLAESNEFGRNIGVKSLLDQCDSDLIDGEPAELHGFDEFDHEKVLANLSRYMVGLYPGLAQCLVAQRR